LQIVGDERLHSVVAVLFEPTFDEIRAAGTARWDVGYADDAIHPLSVQDSLAAIAGRVAGELDSVTGATSLAFHVGTPRRPDSRSVISQVPLWLLSRARISNTPICASAGSVPTTHSSDSCFHYLKVGQADFARRG
jgi:hypothetical protein